MLCRLSQSLGTSFFVESRTHKSLCMSITMSAVVEVLMAAELGSASMRASGVPTAANILHARAARLTTGLSVAKHGCHTTEIPNLEEG